MWIELFNSGTLEKEEITESFNNSKYFVDDSPKEWNPLWHFHDLEDDVFKEYLLIVINKFNNNEYKEYEEFMHVVGVLLNLSKLKLYDKPSIDIVKKAKENIDKNFKILERNIHLDLEISSYGLIYLEKESDAFIEVKDYLLNMTYKSEIDSLEHISKELIEFLYDNNFKEFKDMLSLNQFVLKLYELPVFSKMDVEAFFKAMLSIKHRTFRRVLPVIEKRYSQTNINVLLVDELGFWQEFEKLLDKELPQYEKTIKGVWLNILKNRVVKKNIIDKLEKAKETEETNHTVTNNAKI